MAPLLDIVNIPSNGIRVDPLGGDEEEDGRID